LPQDGEDEFIDDDDQDEDEAEDDSNPLPVKNGLSSCSSSWCQPKRTNQTRSWLVFLAEDFLGDRRLLYDAVGGDPIEKYQLLVSAPHADTIFQYLHTKSCGKEGGVSGSGLERE
jgi:hypothetical protein